MRNKVLTIIALLGIAVGSIQAAETTVTYKMKATFTQLSSSEQADITFVRFGDKLSGPTGEKTATIANMEKCTGFYAELDDGLTFQLVMNEGLVRMPESDGYHSILLNYRGNNNTGISIGSANYYITHIKLADASGNAIYGSAPPFFASATGLDVNVDLVKNTGGGGTMALFNANVTNSCELLEITVTYADTPRAYSIKYHNAVNGENGVTNPNYTSYTVETTGFNITAPSRTGYDFEGFYSNASMSGSPYDLPITIRQASVIDMKNLDLYAKWTANIYTVRFNGNGGEGTMEDQAFTYDQAQALTANAFSRTGYHFAGWNTASDGSGDSYTGGAEVSNLTDVNGATVVLYAQWEANTYAVHFNSNGGEGTMEGQTFYYDEQKALTANTFTKTGYHFAGWTTASNGSGDSYTGGQEVSNLTDVNGAVIDLYAQWEANTYTVSFNSNGGEGTMEGQAFNYDEAQNLTANAFTKTGYHFAGWKTAPDGSGTGYTGGQEVSNLTAVNGGTINLYAQWEANTYTVRFNKNGGNGTMQDETFYYDEQKALTANTFGRTGYDFKGWNTASDGSGTGYDDKAVVSNLSVVNGAVIDLYAQWEAKTIAVTFDMGNEATGGTASVNATYDAPMPDITPPTWEGHCFGGYWSKPDGKGTRYYNSKGTSTINCNTAGSPLELYAYWLDPITYIDADGIEKTCTQYEVIDFNAGRVVGKDKEDSWYTFRGGNRIATIRFKGNAHIIMPKHNATISIDFITADGGDVHIYGTEDGESVITSSIQCVGERKGGVFIHGGRVNITIEATNSLNIGWTNANDYIQVKINGLYNVSIKDGQYFYNNITGILNGTVRSSMINDKRLNPVIPMSDDAANSSVIASYSNKSGGFGLLGRTIYNDGAWNTICFPGGVIRGNGTNPINNNYTIMELDTEGKYNDAGQADEGGTYQTGIKDGILYLYFKETTTIDPGKPYIVRYNGTSERHIVDPYFGVTTIADVSAYSGTDAEKCQAFLEANAAVSKDGRVRFIGQFDPFPIDAGNRYKTIMLGPDNTLGYTEADLLHTMRAHFEILDATAVKGYSISFGEAGTTGIIPIKAEHAAQGIYTLDGLRLESVPSRKGIYIKDGKKVMVND